jgi:isoleucyl-tRNA synthetase
VTLRAPAAESALLERYKSDLAALFIVSEVTLESGSGDELHVSVARAASEKCERCWNRSPTVGRSPEFPTFCARCEAVVKAIVK